MSRVDQVLAVVKRAGVARLGLRVGRGAVGHFASLLGRGYINRMATRAHEWDEQGAEDTAGPDHDAYVRAKVAAGLEQSSDRAAMIPIEQAWRDLTVER